MYLSQTFLLVPHPSSFPHHPTPSSNQEKSILELMPSEAWLGLVRLDCRGLKEHLARRARGLRDSILRWLLADAVDAANTTLLRLRVRLLLSCHLPYLPAVPARDPA